MHDRLSQGKTCQSLAPRRQLASGRQALDKRKHGKSNSPFAGYWLGSHLTRDVKSLTCKQCALPVPSPRHRSL